MPARVLFHVQHLLGIGHQRRSAAIARALARALDGSGAGQVHYVSGGMPVAALDTDGCTFHQLSPVAARDGTFRELVDERGGEVDASWKRRRRDHLLGLLEVISPDLIVTETFPFGRGLLRFELLPLLAWASRRGAAMVCSVRDIIEPRDDPARLERMAAEARQHYAAVLVHGDERILPFSRNFPPWRSVEHLLRPTGYVLAEARPGAAQERDGPVLVSCGGGRVGEALLRAAARARSLGPASAPRWELRVGQDPNAPWVESLRRSAGPGVTIIGNKEGFVHDLGRAAASVSQAGYNTVAEVLASATPSVLVPYDGEREQVIRARAFADAGAAQVVDASALTSRRLAEAVDDARSAPPARFELALDGVSKSVQHILDILTARGQAECEG